MPAQHELLPRESLKDLRLGISVSDSADLTRLGLLETHLRLALAEVARAILISGARIYYGGHLDPNGYTSFLRAEMEKYSRRDRPLIVCLAWQEHRRIPLVDLLAAEEDLGLYGEIVYLSTDGQRVPRDFERTELAEPVDDPNVRRKALTVLRQYMTEHAHARLLVGGKRMGFQGRYPGVLEEALLSIKARRPLFLAGGFGGVTLDIARVLGLDPDGEFRHIKEDQEQAEGLRDGLAMIEASAVETGWRADQNGLTPKENLRLAATHRPSEVASLVALGLGRSNPTDASPN
jgi:SLOG cluster2